MEHTGRSPFGVHWGDLVMGLVAVLLIAALLLVYVRRRRKRAPRLSWLVLMAFASCLWTYLWIAAPVTVSGAQCLIDPHGNNPDHRVNWSNVCGEALLQRMVISTAPSIALLGLVTAAIARGGQISRRPPYNNGSMR